MKKISMVIAVLAFFLFALSTMAYAASRAWEPNYYTLVTRTGESPYYIVGGGSGAVVATLGIFVPAGLYTYVEYKKKGARRTLKGMREARYRHRNNLRKSRGKRGTKRT